MHTLKTTCDFGDYSPHDMDLTIHFTAERRDVGQEGSQL